MSGRKSRARVLKKNVKIASVPVLVGADGEEREEAAAPQARLLEGEEGTRIEVQCTCGRRIVIACEYPRA